ncbi:MAG: alpha-ketoacid dehydrogenase subunit beta [candidate division WOR-3 bacterium]
MAKMNMYQAINDALRIIMRNDNKVIIFGEDVARAGGVFLVTESLLDEFGKERVFDTPVSEAGIVGMAIGLAMGGYKPICEVQFSGFSYLAFNQIISHLSRWQFRSHGRFKMNIVIRMPNGGGVKAPELHSESIENYLIATPGLKVLYPSNPYDAKGLLISAIEDGNPIIFLEHIKLYRYEKVEIPDGYYKVPIGKANVIKNGKDVSIITYGWGVILAKEILKTTKYDIEIIDLRSLSPIDDETIFESVRKTGRVIIISETHKTMSVASEISSLISENIIEYLYAPIMKVCSLDIPYPPSLLEDEYLPSLEKVNQAIEFVMNY